jgi:hypothetical protein
MRKHPAITDRSCVQDHSAKPMMGLESATFCWQAGLRWAASSPESLCASYRTDIVSGINAWAQSRKAILSRCRRWTRPRVLDPRGLGARRLHLVRVA